ncbi:MAG: pilus assembly protein PilM, partial [Candidatus Omnitrophota bacterium]
MSRSAGIYIGADFVDLAVVEHLKERTKVVASVRVPIAEEAGTPENADKLSRIIPAIKKAVELSGQKLARVNFAVPQNEVIIRRFIMPIIPVEERAGAVRFEAQRYLPFKLDDTLSAFYVAAESKTAKNMEVVFVAVNRQVVTNYSNILGKAHLGIQIMDIVPVALLRVFSSVAGVIGEKSKAIVYIEKGMRGSIIIVKEREIYLVREVAVAPSPEAFHANILNNLRLSIDYFKRETKEVDINTILVCADEGTVELEAFLADNIALAQIERFSPEQGIDGLNELSRKQSIAIGIAMGAFERPVPKVNLAGELPSSLIKKSIKEYKPLIIEGIALILGIAVLQIVANVNLSLAQKKVEDLRMEKASMVGGISPESTQEELRALESRLSSQISFLKNLAGENRFFLTKKLSVLGAFFPEGAWIESCQFADEIDKERSFTLKGLVYSPAQNEPTIANKILVDMKASPVFTNGLKEIKLGSLERFSAYDKNLLQFSIECTGSVLH